MNSLRPVQTMSYSAQYLTCYLYYCCCCYCHLLLLLLLPLVVCVTQATMNTLWFLRSLPLQISSEPLVNVCWHLLRRNTWSVHTRILNKCLGCGLTGASGSTGATRKVLGLSVGEGLLGGRESSDFRQFRERIFFACWRDSSR